MKKKYIWIGLGYLLFGISLIWLSMSFEGKMNSLLVGFAGGAIGGGIMLLAKYFYWNYPKHRELYKEKLEEEEIELKDERNETYRDKAGRYAYIAGMIIISISVAVFCILNAANIYEATVIIYYLTALWIFLYIIGIIIYKRLKRDE